MRLLVLLVVAAAVRSALGALVIEHSLDGGASFQAAGAVLGDPAQDSLLTWHRSLTDPELAQLQQLAQRDGFYTVRASGLGKGTFISSVRAACLAGSAAEQVQLQIDHNRNMAGFTYALSSCPASPSGAATALGNELTVRVMSPVAAPLLLMPDVSGGAQFSEIQYDEVAGSLSDPNAKPRAPVGKVGGKPGLGQKDERTWLQKNWMFLAAGVLLVVNVLGKVGAAPAR